MYKSTIPFYLLSMHSTIDLNLVKFIYQKKYVQKIITVTLITAYQYTWVKPLKPVEKS